MKYIIVNAAGVYELRTDPWILPPGAHLLTASEYEQLKSGKFDFIAGTVVESINPLFWNKS